MARLSPEEGFNLLKERVAQTVDGLFPVVGKRHTLELKNVAVKDNLDIDDIESQKQAKSAGRTWAVPVEATVALRDNETGKVVDHQKLRLMNLPKATKRYSHIVDGQEYQIDNQWRLKSGVYARVRGDGELESQFNLEKGRGFHVGFDPQSRQFTMRYGTSNIPLAPLLEEMGVGKEEIEARWGKEISGANQQNSDQALAKFYKASTGNKTQDMAVARQHLTETMDNTGLRPDTTRLTLGKEYKKVTAPALLDAATKLLHISQGSAEPDSRDSLVFKDLHSTEDFLSERIQNQSRDILRRIQNNLDRKKTVRDIIGPDVFQRPVRTMYRTTLANIPEQTNPLEMLSGQMKTTITGEGGIKSAHGITDEAKLVDPSHLGFLDPIHTPEGQTTGVTLRLPIGVKKRGNTITTRMFNVKSGKMEDVSPEKALGSNVVLPDQVRWKGGKPVPVGRKVRISSAGNDITEGSLKDAQYIMRDPMQMLSPSSNLIPFIAADHPNRSTMAGRHMEQAIPLKEREAPLVQSLAGKQTFDSMLGSFAGHSSKVAGEVVKVEPGRIVIKDAAGKRHVQQIYNNFPLNADKAFLHSDSLVKPGDKVKRGQAIADTNFTKGGDLALGTNLRVGYMPYKGYNFEDGVVISESAAQKLSSEHLHRSSVALDKTHTLSKKKFQAYVPDAMTAVQSVKLDDDGIIKPGMKVTPGDTLIAALRQRQERIEDKEIARLHKSLVKPYQDASVKWESDYPGVVTEVTKKGRQAVVHVKTLEPTEIGDKIAGRHGNKGIITRIIPDAEMPHTKDGRPLHVLMNPTGVPGRVNAGQVLETAAGKIAEKTGKVYAIKNFEPGVDLHQKVSQDLRKHGLTDKEEVVDPKTGQVLGSVLVGPQHILKLKHQVEKKLVARAGGPGYAYDANLIPKGGGPHGAQALGTLGLYSMLAHGAKANLREMQTVKSDAAQSDEFWTALQSGEMLPAPRPTFAYNKFMSYLNALGVNVKKDGNNLQLVPFTDKQVEEMSNGVIKDAGKMVRAKDLKEEVGGIFDPKVTGGWRGGTKWSHLRLPEAMPNPLFEPAIQALTGLKKTQFEDVIAGRAAIDPKTGKMSTDTDNHLTGGKAFDHMLGKLDVKTELEDAHKKLQNPNLKGNRLDHANKKVRYLTALSNAELTPREAYMMQNVPVLPPILRPLSQRPDGDLNFDDLNQMYKGIGLSANKLAQLSPLMPESEKHELRAEVYDGLRSLTGLGGNANREFRGVLDIIQGHRPEREGGKGTGRKIGQPKEGYFQKKLVQRKQDLSMRSTIVPEPALGLDEVGLPRSAALEIYKPFVIRELRNLTGVSPLEAQRQIKEGGPTVNKALERVMESRPVLLKRDPVLHKYGIQAFNPRVVAGKAVQIHPLVTSGFNADFDGDAMGAFVPVSAEAVDEARKMYPSSNLFSPSTGDVMYKPTLESQLGLYGLTKPGSKGGKTFKNIDEMESALRKGEVDLNAQVKVGGVSSGVGRFLIAGALPTAMRGEFLKSTKPLDKSSQTELLTRVATDYRNDYGTVVNKLKDLGNRWSTQTAFSLGLDDIKPEKKLRKEVLDKADAEVARIRTKDTASRDAKAVQIYDRATKELGRRMDAMPESTSNLFVMNRSGIKPGGDALRQMKVAPMLIANAKGETIPTPIKRSYAEGLDMADYWTSMSGARKGIIQKVQQVQKPGYLSKQVMNSVMNNVIIDEDCGTNKGVALSLDEKDILDRYLAADVKAGRRTFKAGTLITPDVRTSLRNHKVGRVQVRSPLRCEHGPGICKKCYGSDENGRPPEVGTNVGVLAGQALGERATQLAMKAFHCNHADSLIFIREEDGTRTLTVTMEDLFEMIEEDVRLEGDEEVKDVTGWMVWDGKWIRLTHVRRHAPTRPMMLVSDGHFATVCQDNHPIGVWENNVCCTECGYHRLKAVQGGRYYCASCGSRQIPPDEKIGSAGFLPPSELGKGKYYLHHDVQPALAIDADQDDVDDPPHDPYFVGMFLAEGCVVWKRSYKKQRAKRPYQIQVSQKPGPIRDLLLEHTEVHAPKSKPRYIAIDNVGLGQRFHDLFGRYSRHKSFPADFLDYSFGWLATAVAGIIDGDGTILRHKDGPPAISIDTTSYALAQQIVLICKRMGIQAGIVASTVRELTRHQGFQVRLGMSGHAFHLLGASLKVKSLRAEEHPSPQWDRELSGFARVSAVREVMYTHDYVYDATTETGTLYVSGLKHHNTGGTASSKEGLVDEFERVNHLLMFTQKLPGSATLSTATGKVEKVEKDPAGGHNVFVGGKRHYVPQNRGIPWVGGKKLRAGVEVRKGAPLSGGPINPHEMLPLTGVEPVQGYLASELHGIYGPHGIRRRNTEVVIKALTNLTKVEDPGDHKGFLRGDFAPTSYVAGLNRNLAKGGKPIVHKPVLKGVNVLPHEMQEDWIAKLNHQNLTKTIVQAAQEGWISKLHGPHPIPPVVHGARIGKSKMPWEY